MKFGLLIIGNEILNGKITDINTRALSEYLKRHSQELIYTLTVKDSEQSIHLGLKTLFAECDVVVTSGGLGPTLDDVTKQTIASFMNRKISFSKESMKVALTNYSRFNREFPGEKHGYCMLPEGFIPLNNPVGFAPGLYTEFNGKKLFCAPGVPREFKVLIEDQLLSLTLSEKDKATKLAQLYFRTKKIPEEKIFGEVDTNLWGNLEKLGDVSSLPNYYGVDVGVSLRAQSEEELEKKKAAAIEIMKASPVWSNVWHVGTDTVEEIIIKKAGENNITFGFAESCTGGLCSSRITNVSGASKSFWGSVVSYDNSVKENLIGVSVKTMIAHGAVSIETAREMAAGARKALKTSMAISITGIAGPNGGSVEKPVGTVCIGWSTELETDAVRLQFFGDRELLKNRFSQAALYMLLEQLEKLAGN